MKKLLGIAAAALATTAALPATALADERTCRGSLGAITVDNLRVPAGATCTLTGTRVLGTVKVERAATLRATNIRVVGNVQAENAARVQVASSRIGGSVQVKQGGGAEVTGTAVTGDIQLDANSGAVQLLASNDVNGSIQVVGNSSRVDITRNLVDGNLQCKENRPAPTGGGNVVQGNAEDQCARLATRTGG